MAAQPVNQRSKCAIVLLLATIVTLSASAGAGAAITFSTWWIGVSLLGDLTQELVAAFEEETGIDVEILSIPYSGHVDKLMVMHAGGTAPDVSFVDQYWTANLVLSGLALPLDSFIARDPAISPDDFWPVARDVWRAWWANDETYALPSFLTTFGVMYVPDRLEEAGVPMPPQDWSFDDYTETAKRLTKDLNGDGEPDQWGIAGHRALVENLIFNMGGSIISEDRRTLRLNSPEALAAAQRAAELGAIHHNVIGGQFPLTASMMGETITVTSRQDKSYEYSTVRNPAVDKQASFHLSHGVIINPNTPNLDEAWEFVKWMGGPAAGRIWTKYGYPSGRSDPELVDLYVRGGKPENIRDVTAIVPLAEAYADPTFINYDIVRNELSSIIGRARTGDVDVATEIQSAMSKWQGFLDDFWRMIEN